MTLKWRLTHIGFDPEMKGQIISLLYRHGIDRPEIGITHTELNALGVCDMLDEWPEDEDALIDMFERDEQDRLYERLISNRAMREHYNDLGGFVRLEDGTQEWRWYAKKPERPVPVMQQRVQEILRKIYGHTHCKERLAEWGYNLND